MHLAVRIVKEHQRCAHIPAQGSALGFCAKAIRSPVGAAQPGHALGCSALIGLARRFANRPQGAALGWHVFGPSARSRPLGQQVHEDTPAPQR